MLSYADEKALVSRAIAGDREAFGELFMNYRPQLERYARRCIGSAADDVLSDVALKAYRAIGRYEDRGRPFVTWLRRITHNTIADYMRNERKKAEVELNSDIHASSTSHDQIDYSGLYKGLLGKLPFRQRDFLALYLQGKTYGEIADALGLSHIYVKNLGYRTFCKLESMLPNNYKRLSIAVPVSSRHYEPARLRLQRNSLPGFKIGDRWYIDSDAARSFIAKREEAEALSPDMVYISDLSQADCRTLQGDFTRFGKYGARKIGDRVAISQDDLDRFHAAMARKRGKK